MRCRNPTSVILAGARAPVAFFGYPNMPSILIPEGRTVATLATLEQDVALALEALADLIGAPKAGRRAPRKALRRRGRRARLMRPRSARRSRR